MRMSRPCAYCKEKGHHIRDCRELAEKNRRQALKLTDKQKKPIQYPTIPKPSVVNIRSSVFTDLYSSSDDETEEGEIIEKRSISSLSSESSMKSVHIPSLSYKSVSSKSTTTTIAKSKDDDEYCPEPYVHEPSAAWIKYQGWSWADIEYDSE